MDAPYNRSSIPAADQASLDSKERSLRRYNPNHTFRVCWRVRISQLEHGLIAGDMEVLKRAASQGMR
jgi:hypothetical protein